MTKLTAKDILQKTFDQLQKMVKEKKGEAGDKGKNTSIPRGRCKKHGRCESVENCTVEQENRDEGK